MGQGGGNQNPQPQPSLAVATSYRNQPAPTRTSTQTPQSSGVTTSTQFASSSKNVVSTIKKQPMASTQNQLKMFQQHEQMQVGSSTPNQRNTTIKLQQQVKPSQQMRTI